MSEGWKPPETGGWRDGSDETIGATTPSHADERESVRRRKLVHVLERDPDLRGLVWLAEAPNALDRLVELLREFGFA